MSDDIKEKTKEFGFNEHQWKMIVLKQKLKYEEFIANLNTILASKNERIADLEKVKHHQDQLPPPHIVGEREVLEFKLSRAENEIRRLQKVVDLRKQNNYVDKAVQTERNMNKKQEKIVELDLVLNDMAEALVGILKTISPELEKELAEEKQFRPKNRLEFICLSLNVIQDFIQSLETERSRLKTTNLKLEQKQNELQDLQKTIFTVYQERSFKIEELESLILEREKRLRQLDSQIKLKSIKLVEPMLPQFLKYPSADVSERLKEIISSLGAPNNIKY
jgi:hypothetical protein